MHRSTPRALLTKSTGAGAGARTAPRSLPRAPLSTRSTALHPGAWWLWALGLATAASRTTNPLLLALVIAVAGYVVAARRTDAPWARSYTAFLKLGLLVLTIRLVFAFFLGSPIPGSHVLAELPEVPLPEWARGVRIGGRVTAEGMLFALNDGLKLATLLICVGAANALANPARLLKSLPGALYEAGVAVVVAMTFAPNLVADVRRLRAARRLRGRDDRGLRGVLQVGLPVLEGALERSVALAAAMDARGYGRTAQVPAAVRHTTTALTLGGLLGVCAGTYGLLAAKGAGFGLPVLLVGLALALAGLWLGGRRAARTRYRPDRWGARAWLVSASGAAVGALMITAADVLPGPLNPPAVPLTAPHLPLWPAAAVLLGLLPAVLAPAPHTVQAAPGTAPSTARAPSIDPAHGRTARRNAARRDAARGKAAQGEAVAGESAPGVSAQAKGAQGRRTARALRGRQHDEESAQ
ncbi:energy-coupling factor transporter transmembrane component T [Streptomyces sp. B15]|uniref:energy-coupling factor transporter transmembrane component T n=1 Tax=Streptomyces sp. B15 TaxID=1537797 RepID=UPI001B38E7B2|nr:CbiQ family ECF transporter T component [Streptomyces sp. B15]MBQ1123386.1 energy-coupling factor transporter transmembrane protein EcfT [Streptomyces sp. B15]